MAAPNLNLDNLYVIIDKNNFQQTGSNKDIMDLNNLKDKWSSFGWDTYELDCHDIPELYKYFKELEFTWDRTGGDPITQPNTNALLNKNKSVDGVHHASSKIAKHNGKLLVSF